MSDTPRKLRVFLSHSSGDKEAVRDLYQRLKACGVEPWLDEENILPGQQWETVIPQAIRNADVVLVCVSVRATNQAGFLHREIAQAIDIAEEKPQGHIYIIPAMLEECSIPERLRKFQWVNLADERGYGRLIRSFQEQAKQLRHLGEQVDDPEMVEKEEAVHLHPPLEESDTIPEPKPVPYREKYLEHVLHQHRFFDVKGLVTYGPFPLELEHIFVELKVAPRAFHAISVNPVEKVPSSLLSGQHTIWQFLNAPQMRGLPLAIIGPPGCGKTTLLKSITLSLATDSEGRRRNDIPDRLPVLFTLRQLAPAVAQKLNQHLSLSQAITKQLEREHGPQPPDGWLDQQIEQGRCMVMLDGLDEVADPTLRSEVVAWVERQMRAHARNLFLITSRPHGYKDNPLAGVTVLAVQPFTYGQIQRFVHNWYLVNEAMDNIGGEQDDETVREQARQKSDDLLRRIVRTPRLSELAVNPLLLTMITTVHCYRGDLPKKRVDLYAEICEVFLGKRKQAQGIELDMTPAQKQSVLQPLACYMMLREIIEIKQSEALAVVRESLKLIGSATAGAAFLQGIEEQSGLLLECENGIYSFAHLTFQEYLAAAHFIHNHNLGETLLHFIDQMWWHETILLYAAQSDASAIVAACLDCETPSVAALTLAVDCSEEAKHLQESLRSRVEQLLTIDQRLTDDLDNRWRLAAKVRLIRRLSNLHRLDEQREIDMSYITRVEYKLFLDDKREQGQYRQPGHWNKYSFPPGEAQEPVAGIRAEDAAAFCDWLTQRHGGGFTFRLPTDKEVDEAGTPDHINTPIATWCKDSDTFMLVGLNPQQEQKMMAQLEELCSGKGLEVPRLEDLTRARDLTRACARDLTRDLAHDLARNHNHTRALDRALALDRTLDRVRARARALDRAHHVLDLDRNFDRILHHTLNLNFDRVLNCAFDLDSDCVLTLALTLAIVLNLDDVYVDIEDGYFQQARQQIDNMPLPKNNIVQRQQRLLIAVLDFLIVGERTERKLCKAWQRYTFLLLELVCVGYSKMSKEEYKEEDRQTVLDAYWWLHIVMAREEGTLPAWEGIRIVRERKM